MSKQNQMKHFLTLVSLVIASAPTGLSVWGQSNDCYANPCDLPSQSVALSSDFELWYNFADPIAGVQLDFAGTLVSAGGGIFEELDFYETFGSDTYLAFSFDGLVVPVGCGVLTHFSVASPNLNILGLLVSDASASELPVELLNDGAPLTCIVGCMDPEACNYTAEATVDDGSCADEDLCGECGGDNSTCQGCTNEAATNFSLLASIDDGSCLYNQEAVNAIVSSVECPPSTDSECPGDLTADGSVSVDDILSILSVFGSVCPQ